MANPSGAYTCLRVLPHQKFPMFSFHIERLLFSIQNNPQTLSSQNEVMEYLSKNQGLLIGNIAKTVDTGLNFFFESNAEHNTVTSLKVTDDDHSLAFVTILCVWDGEENGVDVLVHISNAPKLLTVGVGVCVLVSGKGRISPKSKLSQWCWDRKELEKEKINGIHELILSSETSTGDYKLLEGLVTNLFLIKNSTVFTAEEGVLHGHMRELALKACRQLGLSVRLCSPLISNIEQFNEGFLTGAGCVLVPISTILYPHQSKKKGNNEGVHGMHTISLSSCSENSLSNKVRQQMFQIYRNDIESNPFSE